MKTQASSSESKPSESLAEKWGRFPELDLKDNQIIWEAREKGLSVFYPSFPSAMSQAQKTLKADQELLASL